VRLSCVRQVLQKALGSWKGVFLTEGVLVSVFDAFSGAIQTNRRPDLSIIAPGRWAARMPGTGPLRRSSAAARMKAIVGKSRVEAEELQRPAVVFPGSVIGLTF
jgi:hypothetical protein